jgi:serpin B
MTTRTLCIASTALIILAAACGDPSGPPAPIKELPRALTAAEQALIQSSNRFAFDLLREVHARGDAGANVFLSPLSASMALGMTLNGADGRTYEQMRGTLGFGELPQAEINASYRSLIDLLLGLDPAVETAVANSVWARRGFAFEPTFFDAVRQHFKAEARELDFGLPTAPDTINAWVRKQTRDRIDGIVDEIKPLDIMFLLNAVYFKGNWTTRFDVARTQSAPFRRDDGTTVTVQMMNAQKVPMSLGWTDGVQVAELPYGGGAFALIVVLPPDGMLLSEFVRDLDAARWQQWLEALHETDGPVGLPKFQLEYKAALNDALQALGMTDAFDADLADLSRLTPAPDAYITYVKQKTFLKIDEVGTEAAAVTSVGVGVTSAPVGITIDRPFLLAIRERLSGTIMFLGAIADPR